MNKFTRISIAALIALSLTACGQKNQPKQSSSTSQTTRAKTKNKSAHAQSHRTATPKDKPAAAHKAASTSTPKTQSQLSQHQFEQVKLGDLRDDATGGTAKTDLIAQWGAPASTRTEVQQGIPIEMVTWTHVTGGPHATISIGFIKGHAGNKLFGGQDATRSQVITADTLAKITPGTPEATVLTTLGKPNTTTEQIMGGEHTRMLTYTSGVTGGDMASAAVTIADGQVVAVQPINMN